MRLNRIPVITDSEVGVAFDHVNELYNLWLKKPPSTLFIDTAVERSRHMIAQRKCSSEIFFVGNVNDRKGTSQKDNMLKTEIVLMKAEIFVTHEKLEMTKDFFWVHVRKSKKAGSVKDKAKEVSEFKPTELVL